MRHRAAQRRAPLRALGAPHRRVRRQLRSEQRRPGAARAGRLQGQAHQQRVPRHRRARHRAGPGRDPRRLRGAHHACPRHGAHRRDRERPHPAHAGGGADRRRAARRRGRGPRRHRRRRRHHRRALDHRRQPGDRGAHDRAAAAQQAHRGGRPRHVRERQACGGDAGRAGAAGSSAAAASAHSRGDRGGAHADALRRRHRGAAARRSARPSLHATGRQTVARGRDLTACRLLIGTGGALTRLPGGEAILADTRGKGGGERLVPPVDARCALDRDYIFACCGALFAHFEAGAVMALMRRSAGL
ncbi:MAG: glutamate mutase L [Actinobacteria bacterium]|nr:glutamate mutase L [Actinomycetota bacterium]